MRPIALPLGILLAVTAGCAAQTRAQSAADVSGLPADVSGGQSAPSRTEVAEPGVEARQASSDSREAVPVLASAEHAPPPEAAAPVPEPTPRTQRKAKTASLPTARDTSAASTSGAEAGQSGKVAPLLIYTANLTVAVFETKHALDRIEKLARRAGGYLVRRTDTAITVRVPARRFQTALGAVAKVGDVLHQDVSVEDVTQKYTDLTLRLRNAEAVRGQLAELLNKARAVKDALEVERELARVTEKIEHLKGQLRLMRELIAYCTITVSFQPQPAEHVSSTVKLPFPWLDQLGLQELLSL